MPSLNPTKLAESLGPVVDKHMTNQLANAKPAAKLANGLLARILKLADDIVQTAKDCSAVAVNAVQHYSFVGPDAKNVVEPVNIQPASPQAPTQRSSGGGGH